MIKLVLGFTLMLMVHSVPTKRTTADDVADTCLQENNIQGHSKDTMMALLNNEEQITSDLKCYYKCSLQKVQLLGEDGEFTPRNTIEFISAQIGENPTEEELDVGLEAMMRCEFADIEDSCDRSVKMAKCFVGVMQTLVRKYVNDI